MKRAVIAGVGLVLTAGALAACTHSSGSPTSGAAAGGGGDRLEIGGAPKPAQAGVAASLPHSSSDGQAAGSGQAVDAADVQLSSTAKIRTAALTVAVKGARNVAARADTADQIALDAGGEVDGDDRSAGPYATATLLLRVPPAAMISVEHKLSGLGTEQSRTASTRDVTGRVADVASRVKSAQDAITRLQKLYDRASKVQDVIDVENQLSSREADLEALQAQQRALTQETALATITLHLVTAPPVAKHHHPAKKHHGFLAGLATGWRHFTTAATWLATALGAALPFVGLLVLLTLLARLAWPHLGRRAPSPAPAPSE